MKTNEFGDPVKTIAVDLDGTLAKYEVYLGPLTIGDPVPAMVDRVKKWMKDGVSVVIFTARINDQQTPDERMQATMAIQAWSKKNIGEILAVTDRKQPCFSEMWDDRAVRVTKNTGKISDGKDVED